MGALNGSRIIFFNSSDEPVACQKGLSLSLKNGNIDATCKGSNGWKKIIAGPREFSLSLDALTDYHPESGQIGINQLFDAVGTGTEFVGYVSNPEISTKIYVFTVLVDSIELNGSTDGISSYSATFTGSGAITNSELFSNPSFALGSGNLFTGWAKDEGGDSEIIASATGGPDGSRCPIMQVDTTGFVGLSQSGLLVDGKTYICTFDAITSAGTPAPLLLSDFDATNYGSVTPSTSWATYAIQFTWVDASMSNIIGFIANASDGTNRDIKIDNASLKELFI